MKNRASTILITAIALLLSVAAAAQARKPKPPPAHACPVFRSDQEWTWLLVVEPDGTRRGEYGYDWRTNMNIPCSKAPLYLVAFAGTLNGHHEIKPETSYTVTISRFKCQVRNGGGFPDGEPAWTPFAAIACRSKATRHRPAGYQSIGFSADAASPSGYFG